MFKKISYFILFSFLFISINYADTTIPGGYVSGTWEAATSPYLIQGDITIHPDSSLVIEPGVEVIFQGLYTFQINGALVAVGTEVDSISFSAADKSVGWGGIRLDAAADASWISYANIHYGRNTDGGGIYCASPNAEITHCVIADNKASNNGGGICINTGITNPPPVINNCVISRNSARFGGGVFYVADSMVISDCIISDNSAIHPSEGATGGGIYFDGGFVTSINIYNCFVQNNFCESDSTDFTNPYYGLGGGLYIEGRNGGGIFISNCQILSNWSRRSGGGIFILMSQGGVVISDCTLRGNFTKPCAYTDQYLVGGGAIGFSSLSNNSIISRCEISENFNLGYGPTGGGAIRAFYNINASLTLENCTISRNSSLQGWGAIHFNNTLILKNSVVAFNKSGNQKGSILASSAAFSFCDFFSNDGDDPDPVLTSVNVNGDSCDAYANISLDPLFADTVNSDYQITWNNWPIWDDTRSPAINAGDPAFPYDPDSTITDMGARYFNQLETDNLIKNPGCEYTLVNGEIPFWTEVIGSNWTQRTAGPDPYEGLAYFFPGVAALAELQQDVDVSAYKSSIDAGTKSFMFEGYVRAYQQSPPDESRIILEFLDSLKTTKIDSFDSGNYSNTTEWIQITDTSVAPYGTRYIRIRLISTRRAGSNNDGYFDGLSLVAADVTGIEENIQYLPDSPILFQNYPNPFNPITLIRFDLPKSDEVELVVYDMLGRKVSTLLNGKVPAGRHDITWNAVKYASGFYFYQLTTARFKKMKKMLLLK